MWFGVRPPRGLPNLTRLLRRRPVKVWAYLRGLLSGREAKGASALAVSSVIAQGIALLVTPVLSRIYEPEAFGYLALVVSVTGMITPAVALRLESAVMLPRTGVAASALLVIGFVCAIVLSLATVGFLELLFALGWLEVMARLPGFSWWVGGISFLSGTFMLLGQFALRARRYGVIALRNVTQGATTAVAQLVLAFASASPLGLVGGYAIGRIAGIAPLLKSLRAEIIRFNRAQACSALRKYRTFPLLFAPAALLNAASLALPIIFAGLWFDVAAAGHWGMAERILAVPLVVVAAALGQVVEARLAHHLRTFGVGSLSYYIRVSGFLLVFSVMVGAVVILGAPAVVPFVLGAQWEATATIMQLLTPMLVTRLIASPMSKALIVAQWAKTNLVLDLFRALLLGGVLLACWSAGSTLEAFVIWTSLAFSLVYLLTWFTGLAAARQLDLRAQGSSGCTINEP